MSDVHAHRPDRLTRRELLAYLAGVPLTGLVGCGFRDRISFEGQLLSPDVSIGHRLRDGWRPPEPTESPRSHRVVIVGGGIAGLSAAWQLQRRGIEDFVVLELEGQPGGTSLSGDRAGFRFPWGAHYVPAPMKENEALVELFGELGAIVAVAEDGEPVFAEHALCREPEERVFFQGRWIGGLYPHAGASDEDLSQLERFRQAMRDWSARRDQAGRRMFAIPMSLGSDGDVVRKLDTLSMDQWMQSQGFTSQRLRWLVDYACRDDYGLTSRQTSAWAGVFYFASRLRPGSAQSQPVITWPEGNGRIVGYLADRCGTRLRCGHAVTAIRDTGAERIQIRAFDTRSSTTVEFVAEDVVFAAPQFLAPHVLVDWKSSGRTLTSFRYGGWVVANVFLNARPQESGSEMCWDNVIYDSRSLGYVTSTHQTGSDHGPTVLTWYQPMLDDDPRVSRAELMRLAWRDWASVVVSDLRKAHPDIGSLIERIDVMRWGHAMIQPRVGFVWGDQRQAAAHSLGRVHFAGTDLSGVALMEEAFDRGVRAADRCLASPVG
ncbi:flavin monoamine oxidase family protein [Stieleria neptunia]|uniref:flavin monoamine oxidase family protein n=1 Tax=Stieleria neptunia TaxID=2527979 RepID=UPI0018D24B8F|nr:FAD-dependent oxidoreductase [Stieleria neptunia]